MSIFENVVSGVIVALLLWGARQAGVVWRRRRAEGTAGHGSVDVRTAAHEPVNNESAASAGKE
ncbi:hypothetical protein [Streptomyces sp. NPDC090022]|uniref:hypothetical protein n=1 Tax=Streptomyces sp. NPDC090022 TaxID=3365920 RepID=UPI003813F113